MIRVFDQGDGLLLVYGDTTRLFLAKNATKNQAIEAIKRGCFTYGNSFSNIAAEKAISNPEPFIRLAEEIENTMFYSNDEFLKLLDAYDEDYQNTTKKCKNELDKANERAHRTERELKRLEKFYAELKTDYFDLEKENEKLKEKLSDAREGENSHAKMATESEKPRNATQTAQESPQAREKPQTDKLSSEGMEGLKTQINAKFADMCKANKVTDEMADLLFNLSMAILMEICDKMIEEDKS